jgi:hypothetical protein
MPSDATPRREGGNSGDDRRNSLRSRRFLLPVVGLLVLLLGSVAGWLIFQRTNRLPQPGEPAYADLVRAFYKGTVALQVVEPDRAESQLTRATQIAPREAAPFANLGLYYLRGLRGSPELDRQAKISSEPPISHRATAVSRRCKACWRSAATGPTRPSGTIGGRSIWTRTTCAPPVRSPS